MPPLNIKIIFLDNLAENGQIWFDGLCMDVSSPHTTCLTGEVADYPALYGLLERIRDLNLHLESVQVQPLFQKGTNK